MAQIRKPFEGVLNIIRFNWHFYVISLGMLLLIILLNSHLIEAIQVYVWVIFAFTLSSTLISLVVSCYVYDFSALYKMTWLDDLSLAKNGSTANINAGFDETSSLLKEKFSQSELMVFDFYDAAKHTEISIKRARKRYPPFPNTIQVNTSHLPLADKSIDTFFALLAAHEIRDEQERIVFFNEIKRVLKPLGKVIVTEHLRDEANFLAYNVGFFHFHSKATWYNTFKAAGFMVEKELKITPFITTFILNKNGITT